MNGVDKKSVVVHIYVYGRPLGFTVIPPEMYTAGGLQSEHTINLIGVQYKLH